MYQDLKPLTHTLRRKVCLDLALRLPIPCLLIRILISQDHEEDRRNNAANINDVLKAKPAMYLGSEFDGQMYDPLKKVSIVQPQLREDSLLYGGEVSECAAVGVS